MKRVLLPGDPPELLVYDEPERCPYLPGEWARFPMRLPLRVLTSTETDARLSAGDRRHGRLLYRPTCATCRSCEPIRIDVNAFEPSRTQRRILRRGDRLLIVEVGEPILDDARVRLYERHKRGRDLAASTDRPLGREGYAAFLVDRCVEALELRYFHQDRLVGVAITDRGAVSMSAVYCFFDPALPHLSIGTYSILKQIELCRSGGFRHLYLGLYIAESPHMRYKRRFLPHERRIAGEWRRFTKGEDGEPVDVSR